jgi:RNA polymerase sigma-70 factor (ECF subfamily)
MYVQDDDADLIPTVEAARAGDPLAFEALVRRFRAPVTAYAFSLLRDRGYAEDAAQETLLLAYRRIRAVREPRRFSSWLFSIVENVAFTGSRSRRRRPSVPLKDGDAVAEGTPWEEAAAREEPGPGEDPGGASREVLALRSSLERIRPCYAEILRLHYLDGLSHREMAAALNLTQNNARMRLRRARGALRRDLAEYGAAAVPGEAPR